MKKRMHASRGWTIVQIMTALLVAGIVAAVAVEVVIDLRCEADPARQICAGRSSVLPANPFAENPSAGRSADRPHPRTKQNQAS